MTPLPETLHLDGFSLTMMKREGPVAMFKKTKQPDNTGYEVVIVQTRKAETYHGRTYPARELMPNNEDWGRYGWSFVTRECADSKFAALTSRRSARLYCPRSQPRHFTPQDTHCCTPPKELNQ